MKRIVFLLSILFCSVAFAHTIEWYVDGNILSTTTCESGDNITPPTAPAKYGYHFVKWKLPYTQIEYLQATGSQWINTGVKVNQSLSYIKFIINYTPATTGCLMGANGPTQMRMSNLVSGVKQNAYSLYYVSSGININVVNDVIKESVNQGARTSLPLYLFSLSGWGTYCEGKLYSAQIILDDILVRNFIPVLDEDGIPCMYDKVEHKFYYNQGTGQFIAGPIINE